MKHLIFLVPGYNETCDIAKELGQVGVKENDLHVYSNNPESLKKAHIHPLTAVQMANLAVVVGRALIIGIVFSIAIYALFASQLPSNIHMQPIAYVGIIVFGFGFGFWVSGMIGLQTLKEFITKYDSYVREGHYLMMVDALDKREKELIDLIIAHHANVKFSEGIKH